MYTSDILTKVSQHTKLLHRFLQENQNWDYYEGDQFKYWIGSMPGEGDPNRERVLRELERVFISENLIKECVDRHVNALIAEFPKYSATSLSGEDVGKAANDAVQKIINDWLNTSVIPVSQESDEDTNPLITAITKMVVTGRGYLRLFSRKRYAQSLDTYKRISLHSPASSQIRMIYDDEGSLEAIEYIFDHGKIERQELDPVTGVLHFSIYESETKRERGELLDSYSLDLNHNWSIIELRSPSLVTDSIKRLQNGINLALTMMSRNVIQAGFLERLILNAQSPGEFVEDPNTGDITFMPDPKGHATGAGSVTYVRGLPIGDDPMNPTGYTNPSAVFREPVKVETFEKTHDILRACFYQSMGQGHILTQGDGNISGISRVHLSQDFSNKVKNQVVTIEASLAACFYSALLMLSSQLPDRNQQYKKIKLNVQLTLNDHLVTPEEHKEIRDDFAAGIVSHETTLLNLGFDDVQAELDKVNIEREEKLKQVSEQLGDLAPASKPEMPK